MSAVPRPARLPRRTALAHIVARAVAVGLPLPAAGYSPTVWAAAGDGAALSGTPAYTFTGAPVSLPFDMPDLRHIIVAGEINGRPARILLDSGVGAFALTRGFADAIGLASTGVLYGQGVAGGVAGLNAGGVRVRLGAMTFATPAAAVFDLDDVQAASGSAFDAIMGRDLFDQVLADIDFAARRLTLTAPNLATRLPGGREIALSRTDFGMWCMPVAVEGAALAALIDFGADRPFHLSPYYAGLDGLLAGRRVTTAATGSVAGIEIGRLFCVGRVAAGGVTFTDVPTEVPRSWAYAAQAILGFPVFRRFRVLADFANDRICLRPAAAAQPFRKDRSGIAARKTAGSLEIVHIADGSPAARAGFAPGEVIVAINGQRLSPAYFAAHPRDGAGPAGTPFAFTLKDGATRKLVLEDYF